MRSRILNLRDPRGVDLSGFVKPFAPDAERLERELRRAVNPFVRWEEGETVAKGDLVVCRLCSDCPRFNKEKVKFAAGSGMFHRQLEALTFGMTVNETREIELEEGRVALTVSSVTRRVAPELSDELVARMGLEGVTTVEEYTRYLTDLQREEQLKYILYDALRQLIREVIGGSEFVLCQEDWQYLIDLRLKRLQELCTQEGMVLEEMTPEQFEGRIPVKSYHELVVMEQRTAWEFLCMNLIGRYYAARLGRAPSDAGYEAEIREYTAAWGVSEEKARRSETYENYAYFYYNNLASEVLEDVVREEFTKEAR